MRQHRNLRAPPLSTGWFRFQIDHHTCSFSNTSIGLKKKYQLLRSIWFPESLNVLRYLSVVFPSVFDVSEDSCIKLMFLFCFSHNWILLKFSPFLYVCVTWGSVCASPVGPAKLHYWWRWLSLFLPLSLFLNEAEVQNERTNKERHRVREKKNIKVKARWKKRLEAGWKGQKDVKKDERRLKEAKVAGIKWDKKTKDQEEEDKWNKKQHRRKGDQKTRTYKGQKRGQNKRCERRK